MQTYFHNHLFEHFSEVATLVRAHHNGWLLGGAHGTPKLGSALDLFIVEATWGGVNMIWVMELLLIRI